MLAYALGQYGAATTLLGAATALQQTIGMPQRPEARAAIEAAREAPGPADFATIWKAAESMPLDAAIEVAQTFLASVRQGQGGRAPECRT